MSSCDSIHTTILKKNTYKIWGIQCQAVQVAEDGSDYDYGEIYQFFLQISCYSEKILSQDLLAMQQKQQGLICKYLHFLVNNAHLVKKVGNSYLGFMYCLVKNKPHLTFEDFFHTSQLAHFQHLILSTNPESKIWNLESKFGFVIFCFIWGIYGVIYYVKTFSTLKIPKKSRFYNIKSGYFYCIKCAWNVVFVLLKA